MVDLEYYLESVVNSIKDTPNVQLAEPITTKKIIEFSQKLNDIRLSVNKLDEIWKKRIKLNKKLIGEQDPDFKKDIYQLIYKLNSLQILIKQKQAINEYIGALAAYLKYLKVAAFKKDKETINRIAHKFLSDKLNITYLSSQIDELNDNIKEYEDKFNVLMSKLSEINSVLEFKISNVFSPNYPKIFKEMHITQKRQKYLIYHIGKNFLSELNSACSKREISSIINDAR